MASFIAFRCYRQPCATEYARTSSHSDKRDSEFIAPTQRLAHIQQVDGTDFVDSMAFALQVDQDRLRKHPLQITLPSVHLMMTMAVG